MGILLLSSPGGSSGSAGGTLKPPPMRGFQTTEPESETEDETRQARGGDSLKSPYYRQFAELVFRKPAGEITGEELDRIQMIQAEPDVIYYSFSDPDEEGYPGTIQSVALESREQDEQDLLQFQGLVKLEVELLKRPGDLAGLPKLRSLTVRYFGSEDSNLEDYGKLTGLLELSVRGSGLTGLEGIEKMTSLKRLTLDSNRQVKDGSPVSGCTGLVKLSVDETSMGTFPDLSGCKSLQSLELVGAESLGDLAGL